MRNAVIVEIRSGEGGNHAKRLVDTIVDVYEKYGARRYL